MSSQEAKTDRLVIFSDGVFAVLITILVLDLKPPESGDIRGVPCALARRHQLCDQLPVHCDRLGQPSSPAALCKQRNAAPDLGKLCAPLLGIAHSVLDGLDCGHADGRYSRFALCRHLSSGERHLPSSLLGSGRPARYPGSLPHARRMMRTRSLLTIGIFAAAVLAALVYPAAGMALICLCLRSVSSSGTSGRKLQGISRRVNTMSNQIEHCTGTLRTRSCSRGNRSSTRLVTPAQARRVASSSNH